MKRELAQRALLLFSNMRFMLAALFFVVVDRPVTGVFFKLRSMKFIVFVEQGVECFQLNRTCAIYKEQKKYGKRLNACYFPIFSLYTRYHLQKLLVKGHLRPEAKGNEGLVIFATILRLESRMEQVWRISLCSDIEPQE
jgi:hypothetical protein